MTSSYRERLAAAAAMHSTPNALVSRILQVALGLFVTTSDLPTGAVTNPLINFDCNFETECRWTSAGNHFDHWRVARGEPDSLLWLAATGTMQLPTQSFALVEIKGQPTDVLISDTIACHDGPSSLSFVYWAIGNADLEVCLTDVAGVKFNCTGFLESPVMPGKVLLKIPEMQRPFRIMITPNSQQGVLIVDDINYDAQTCQEVSAKTASTRKRVETSTLFPRGVENGSNGTVKGEKAATSKAHSTPESLPVLRTTLTEIVTTPAATFPTLVTEPKSTQVTSGASSTQGTTMPFETITLPRTTTESTEDYEEGSSSTESESTSSEIPEHSVEEVETISQFKNATIERSTRTPESQELPNIVDEIDELSPKSGGAIEVIKEIERWRVHSTTTTTTTTEPTTTTTTTEEPTPHPIPSTTTDHPFDLMIYGNLTAPLFDRRLSIIVSESSKLLCDFQEEFACQWGVEAGRWAIVKEGAIPSLEEDIGPSTPPPTFPAALVLQGTVMLTSDPVRCQTGPGKVLFRQWSNGNVSVQVCALGYGINNTRIECFDRQPVSSQDMSLAVFEIPSSIREPFTLNIVPQWPHGVNNKYLILDEVAYIGECAPPTAAPTEPPSTTRRSTTGPAVNAVKTHKTSKEDEEEGIEDEETVEGGEEEEEEPEEEITTTTRKAIKPQKKSTTRIYPARTITTTTRSSRRSSEERPDETEEASAERIVVIPASTTTTPQPTSLSPRFFTSTPRPTDFCSLLNCDFNDSACNYLNHGLTKVPWTLRNKPYGHPLTGAHDIRTNAANGQFVSSLLSPGDIAILESPKFNLSANLNVLLFQYYRPSQSSTLRLCLGSRYTTPLRTVAAFTRCPSILRAVTARNAYKWNTVHVQLPPGTTHFFIVAHNSERAETRTSVALDNLRVAICDPKNYPPEEVSRMFSTAMPEEPEHFARAHGIAQFRPPSRTFLPAPNRIPLPPGVPNFHQQTQFMHRPVHRTNFMPMFPMARPPTQNPAGNYMGPPSQYPAVPAHYPPVVQIPNYVAPNSGNVHSTSQFRTFLSSDDFIGK